MTNGAILYGCPQSFMVALVDYFWRVALLRHDDCKLLIYSCTDGVLQVPRFCSIVLQETQPIETRIF